jgi:glutathione peroxidase
MQAQQSLFQSAFKDPNQRTAHGVKKSIPFLNLWAPSQDVQRYQEQQKRDLNSMASATSFYDFKPLDSTCGLNSNLFHAVVVEWRDPSSPLASLNGTKPLLTTTSTEKGAAVPLDAYKGKVVLIVNTASKCGFTPQYQGLESLYKKISASHPDQFVILGFPCNQFGGQEPVRPPFLLPSILSSPFAV